MRNKLILLLFISVFIITSTINGQKQVNSPYSRFNIGTIEQAGSFRGLGMGGLSVAMRDNISIYSSNPASYSAVDTNSFIFDFGLDLSWNKLVEVNTTYKSNDINFDHLIMGFPIRKGWGFAVGVLPVSNGYYNIAEVTNTTDINYDAAVGPYASFHSGDGSFTNVFAGTGLKIFKNLSAGVNMNVMFGSVNRTNNYEFIDFYNVYNSSSTEKLELYGINFDYGLHFFTPLRKGYFLNAGASFTTGKNYNTKYQNYTYSYTAFGSRDTISYSSDNSKSTYLPSTIRFGVTFGKINKFTAGLDFIQSNWADSKIPGITGYAADTRSLLFGAELIPEKYSNYSYLKRVEYRIGGHIGNNYLIVNGEQVKEYGVSFGFGIPMSRSLTEKKSLSRTNLFFDFTQKRGSEINNLILENYFTVGLSLNLYDFWFVKRKYE